MTPAETRQTLRSGGLFGLAGNLLMMVSVPLAPPWPTIAAPTTEVVHYFATYQAGFLRQAWVGALGVVLLLGFAGALAALLRDRAAFASAAALQGAMTVFVAGFAVNWTPWVAIAMRPDRDPAVVQALYDFGLIGQFVGVGAPLALLFGTLVHAARLAVIPRGFALPAAAAVAVNVLLAGATRLEGPMSPSGPVGLLSIALFGLPLTACSVWMLVASRRTSAPPATGNPGAVGA